MRNGPDANGLFSGIRRPLVAETLMPLILDLDREYERPRLILRSSRTGLLSARLRRSTKPAVFRRTPDRVLRRRQDHLKREELNHTGAHKINNCIGQILLARRMGKKRIIAETGAGMHGVATATVCARFGLECVIFYGQHRHPSPTGQRTSHEAAGPEVPVVGTGTLKDAMNEALRDWVTNVDTTFYPRHCGRPAPVSGDGPRLPGVIGIETRTRCNPGRSPAGQPGGLRRRWLERHGPVPPVPER